MSERSKTLLVAALAALGGGLVGGVVAARVLVSPASNVPVKERTSLQTTGKTSTPQQPEAAELDERVADLEGQLRALRNQRQSAAQLRQYAEALARGNADAGNPRDLAPVVDAEDPSFELAVRTVMDRVEWEHDEEQRVTRAQRWQERATRQAELLSERLGLSPSQRAKVEPILAEQMEAFRALRDPEGDAGARPASRREWRTRLAEIRQGTEAKLGAVLDQKQLASYREFVDEEGFGPRGGRGGPPR
jgi:hypothetical protein